MSDVLQLRIRDAFDTYATLRLAEMPLCEGYDESGIITYVQVGTKQLKLNVRMIVDQALLKQKQTSINTANAANGLLVQSGLNPLMMGLGNALAKKVETAKKEGEFVKKQIKELSGLPAADQVKKLKMMINDQENQ